MLIHLQALDIVPRKRQARCANYGQHPHAGLRLKAPAESSATDHQGTDVGDQDEQDDHVAVDTVEEQKLVSNDGDELEYHEKASWKDSAKVERDPYSIVACAIPEPFARCGAVCEAAGRGAGDVEIGQASEGEAEHCAGEDDDFCSLSEAETGLRKGILHKRRL